MQDVYQKARRIRLAIFDVDGVLTDGSLYFTDSGEEIKAFNVRDGHGMKMLREGGVRLAIITSRTSRCVELRAKNLGIDLLYQGVRRQTQACSGNCWRSSGSTPPQRLTWATTSSICRSCGTADWP